eukprot:11695427-Karenia_brevis.AAC.1
MAMLKPITIRISEQGTVHGSWRLLKLIAVDVLVAVNAICHTIPATWSEKYVIVSNDCVRAIL